MGALQPPTPPWLPLAHAPTHPAHCPREAPPPGAGGAAFRRQQQQQAASFLVQMASSSSGARRPPYRLETEYTFNAGDMTAFLVFS